MGRPAAPPAEGLPTAPAPANTLLDLLDEILEVQRQRALAYTAFSNGFKSYLNNGAEGPYRHLMASLTSQFQAMSRRVLAVEATLRDILARPDVADLCRTVQNAERRKLELTLTLQAVRAAVEQERFEWLRGGDHGVGAEDAAAAVGHDHGHGHSCGACGVSAADVPPEPTEAEVRGATREGTQEMEACVNTINEAIAELQELRAEIVLEGQGEGEGV